MLRSRSTAGFTLAEVVFAMVILSIGFLGLQALGIGAARMVSRADREGRYVRVATQELEGALQQIRLGITPQSGCEQRSAPAITVSRAVDGLDTTTPRVTVTVSPLEPNGSGALLPVTMQGSAYNPNALDGADAGSPCPT